MLLFYCGDNDTSELGRFSILFLKNKCLVRVFPTGQKITDRQVFLACHLLLGAHGSLWEPVGARGSSWEPVGASACCLKEPVTGRKGERSFHPCSYPRLTEVSLVSDQAVVTVLKQNQVFAQHQFQPALSIRESCYSKWSKPETRTNQICKFSLKVKVKKQIMVAIPWEREADVQQIPECNQIRPQI